MQKALGVDMDERDRLREQIGHRPVCARAIDP